MNSTTQCNCSNGSTSENCTHQRLVYDMPRQIQLIDEAKLNVERSAPVATEERTYETHPPTTYIQPTDLAQSGNVDVTSVFVVSPTYHRTTQKVDLTSMCYTLTLVPKLTWIVIEDASGRTALVTKLLQRCNVTSIHLNILTSSYYHGRDKYGRRKARGVQQRNLGLVWLRKHYNFSNCNGVVYFADDDNRYDLRLFEEVCHLLH